MGAPVRHVGGITMKCQKCSKPATLHITEIEDGQPLEVHLCDECARQYLTHQAPTAASGLAEHLTKLDADGPQADTVCPTCGSSWNEFRQSGRLGCPADYDVFARVLHPLLESVHGATAHAGKAPRHGQADTQHQAELRRLRQELKDAVAQEAYETAARIRDLLRELQAGKGTPDAGPA